jgi:ParB family chromosome partitioning protein
VGMRAIEGLALDPDDARPVMGSLQASKRWRDALDRLTREPFIQDDDMAAAFRAFRSASISTKQLAAAAVAGLALERSLAGGTFDLPVHDAVAAECGVIDDADFRRLWEPSAEQLAILPTHHRLAIAEPFVERITLGAWQRLKSADLTARVLEVVTGTAAGVRATMATAAATWVPALLRFRPAQEPEQMKEAAE